MRRKTSGLQNSLASMLGAGAAILVLILAPVSAAYLFQTSVVGQGFGGEGGMSRGGPGGNQDARMKSEVTRAEKAGAVLETALAFDVTKCDAVADATARYESAAASLEELASYDDLPSIGENYKEINDAKKEMKDLKNDLAAAKKERTKAAKYCKKEVKKIMKVEASLRSLPLNNIEGAEEMLANIRACFRLTQPGPGPRGHGGGFEDEGFEEEGSCAAVLESIATVRESGLPDFIEERKAGLEEEAARQEEMNQNFGGEGEGEFSSAPSAPRSPTNSKSRQGNQGQGQGQSMNQQQPQQQGSGSAMPPPPAGGQAQPR